MRKEIYVEEMMRMLTCHKEKGITCKRLEQQQKEVTVINHYQMQKEQEQLYLYDKEQSFTVSLEGIRQVCADTGMSHTSKEKYLLFTITYDYFDHISLNIAP